MKNGQFQVYHGDGKGKTSAAIGLAVRASGAGLSVYIGQFIKDMEYGEVALLRQLPNITVELYGSGRGCFIGQDPDNEDIIAAKNALEKAKILLSSCNYDVFIMDEINIAYSLGLLSEDDLLRLINFRPDTTELIFTGRNCPESVLERADLITEMKEIRHYYTTKHLIARDGIER